MYTEVIEKAARMVEDELLPGAEDLIADRVGRPPLGGFPGAGMPDVPQVPSVPGMPAVPGMPSVPEMPAVPGMPGVPSMPAVPGMPAIPGVPDGSGLVPDLNGLMPSAPGMPGGLDQAEEARKRGEAARTEWLRQEFGDDLGLESSEPDGYADFAEPEKEAEKEHPAFAEDEEGATAVLLVCRNGWNTIDTRAVGGHWFSA